MLLAVFVLQLSLVALGGAVELCAQPGAARCEQGRHLSVCLERSRVWHRVSDCAASGGFCADGRCVGGVDGRSARESCTYPSNPKCSEDCGSILICITSGNWSPIKCGKDLLCDETTVTCKPKESATCKSRLECPPTDLKITLPDLTNSSRYYDCKEEGEGIIKNCQEGEFYNACSGDCDYKKDPIARYPDSCNYYNPGYSNHIFSNPGLYYICFNEEPFWMQCPGIKGYYDSTYGECVGESNYWQSCDQTETTSSPDESTTTPTI